MIDTEQEDIIKTKAKEPKKARRSRWLIKFLFLMILSFIVLQITFLFFATPLMRTGIQALVQRESDGIYSLNFDSLSVNISTRSFVIFGLHFKPDEERYAQKVDSNTVDKALYDIKLSSLELSTMRLVKLYQERKLNLARISVGNPVAKLIGLPKNDMNAKQYDAINEDLYPAILEYLNALEVDLIEIDNGSFNFSLTQEQANETSTADKIGISLENFYLDKETFITREQLFFARYITVRVAEYDLLLNDSIHTINARNLLLSTRDNLIRAEAVSLFPGQLSPREILNGDFNYFDAVIPDLQISGFDINRLFNDEEVVVARLELKKPEIAIFIAKSKERTQRENQLEKLDLYKLIQGSLNFIFVHNFNLDDASLSIFTPESHTTPAYKAASINISFSEFMLDSTAHLRQDKIFYASEFEFSIEEFRMLLNDGIHSLHAQNLSVNTRANSIIANNVALYPNRISKKWAKKQEKTLITARIPYLQLQQANLKKLYNAKQLPINNLILSNAYVDILQYADSMGRHKKKYRKESNFQNLVNSYLNGMYINNVQINNSNVAFSRELLNERRLSFEGNFSFLLEHFSINPDIDYSSEKPLFADEMHLVGRELNLAVPGDFHKIRIGEILASTRSELLIMNDLSIQADTASDFLEQVRDYQTAGVINMNINRIDLISFNIWEVYSNKKLQIDKINIYEPELDFIAFAGLKDDDAAEEAEQSAEPDDLTFVSDSLPDLLRHQPIFKELSSIIDTAAIGLLSLQQGRFSLVSNDSVGNQKLSFRNQLSAQVHEMSFNMDMDVDSALQSDRLFFSDSIKIQFYDYTFALPDKVHNLRIDELDIDAHKSAITAKQIKLDAPRELVDSFNIPFYASMAVPVASINGVDIKKLLFNNLFEVDSMTIPTARLELYKHEIPDSLRKQKKTLEDIALKLPNGLVSINLGDFSLKNTDLYFYKDLNDELSEMIHGNLQLNLNKFHLDSITINQPENFLHARDLMFTLKNARFLFADSIQKMYVKNLSYSSHTEYLRADSLAIGLMDTANLQANLLKEGKTSAIEMYFRQLNAEGLDLDKSFATQQLDISYMEAYVPEFTIHSFPQIRRQLGYSKRRDIEIFKLIDPNFEQLNIEQFDFSINQVKINKRDTVESMQHFDYIVGTWKDFQVDSVRRSKNVYRFYEEDLVASARFFKQTQQDKNMQFSLNEYGIATHDSSVFLNGLEYFPLINKKEFAKHHGFSYSHNNLFAKHIKIQGIDWQRFIDDKELICKEVRVESPFLEVYKDKNYPLDTTRIMKMPIGMLRDIKLPFIVNDMDINNMTLRYEELNKAAKNSGTVLLDSMNLDAQLVSNHHAILNSDKSLNFSTSAYIMKSGKFNIYGRMPYNSANESFRLAGSMDTMSLNAFNQYLEHTTAITIRDGFLNNLRFSMSGNNQEAEGVMRLRYKKLKVNLMKSEKDSTYSKRGLGSYMANTILRKRNPRAGSLILREGQMYAARDENKPVFNLWVNTLISGIKSTLGFRSKEMRARERLKKIIEKRRQKAIERINKNKDTEKDWNLEDLKKGSDLK